MTDDTSGARNAYTSGAPEFTHGLVSISRMTMNLLLFTYIFLSYVTA
jgi:hypothetical protein